MSFSKSIVAGATALALAGSAHAASFADGTFSEGVAAGSFATVDAGSKIGAWTVTSGSVDLIGSYWPGPSGSYSLDMNGLTAGTISQTFTLGAGEYRLSFWIAANPDGGPDTRAVLATVGDASQTFTFDATGATKSDMGWTLETMTFTTAGTTTLSFASETDPTSGYAPYGASIGGVSVTAVPEPTSLGLLLGGLGLFGVMASRRRAR